MDGTMIANSVWSDVQFKRDLFVGFGPVDRLPNAFREEGFFDGVAEASS